MKPQPFVQMNRLDLTDGTKVLVESIAASCLAQGGIVLQKEEEHAGDSFNYNNI